MTAFGSGAVRRARVACALALAALAGCGRNGVRERAVAAGPAKAADPRGRAVRRPRDHGRQDEPATPGNTIPQAMPGVGILHFAAAAGVWERRRWAWVAALVYGAAGAAALLPIGAALPFFVSRYLLALGSLGVVANPVLVLHRREFLTLSAARPPGAS